MLASFLVLLMIFPLVQDKSLGTSSPTLVTTDRKIALRQPFDRDSPKYSDPFWQAIALTSDSIVQVDLLSVRWIKSDIAQAWFKERNTVKGQRGKHHHHVIVLYELNCESEDLQVLSWTAYDSRETVVSTSRKSQPKSRAIPGSIGSVMLKTICRPESRETQ